MTHADKERLFCELLEAPELSELDWQTLEDLAFELDLEEDLRSCCDEIIAELEWPMRVH